MTDSQLVYRITTGEPAQDFRWIELKDVLTSYVGGQAEGVMQGQGRYRNEIVHYRGEVASISIEGDELYIEWAYLERKWGNTWTRSLYPEFYPFEIKLGSAYEASERGDHVLGVVGANIYEGVWLYPQNHPTLEYQLDEIW